MEFRDLKRQYIFLKEKIDAAVASVISSGAFIMGPQVSELESRLADYAGVSHCVSCANGTDALRLALEIWNIGPGDAVFVPDFTFFASAEVVAAVGATPVFVDVDARTFNMSADDLQSKIDKVLLDGTLAPKAIIAVDLFGLPADFLSIRTVADKYNLLILEDAAQGFGGAASGKRACSFGDIATTSFFPAKPLGCYGDGGALFTDNPQWAELARSLKVHGKGQDKYDNVRIGCNSRLDTLQAAVLLVKLDAFVQFELSAVSEIADLYTSELHNLVLCPVVPAGFSSSWAQYTVQLENPDQRAAIQQGLRDKGIPSMVYYPKPMHSQGAFRSLGTAFGHCPVSSRLALSVLSLPMHPYLDHDDVHRVADTLKTLL